ncbi:MAG: hypothetical protein RH859_00185 [Longimicrobiales bacterium]
MTPPAGGRGGGAAVGLFLAGLFLGGALGVAYRPAGVQGPAAPPTAAAPAPPGSDGGSGTVWAVDLVRTLPDMAGAYRASIEANWASARALAVERGTVVSYRALTVPEDGPDLGPWNLVLMTEYADEAAHAAREATFDSIFASPAFVFRAPAHPSADMRAFAAGDVVLRTLVEGPAR